MLTKAAKALDSTVTITKADGKSAVATKRMALMGLGVKNGGTHFISLYAKTQVLENTASNGSV